MLATNLSWPLWAFETGARTPFEPLKVCWHHKKHVSFSRLFFDFWLLVSCCRLFFMRVDFLYACRIKLCERDLLSHKFMWKIFLVDFFLCESIFFYVSHINLCERNLLSHKFMWKIFLVDFFLCESIFFMRVT